MSVNVNIQGPWWKQQNVVDKWNEGIWGWGRPDHVSATNYDQRKSSSQLSTEEQGIMKKRYEYYSNIEECTDRVFNPTLQKARRRHRRYRYNERVYRMGHTSLLWGSGILAIGATVCSVIHETNKNESLEVIILLLPIMLLVLEGLESKWKVAVKKASCHRAAGLVESEYYRFRTQAGKYSDANCTARIGTQSVTPDDIKNERERQLEVELEKINKGAKFANSRPWKKSDDPCCACWGWLCACWGWFCLIFDPPRLLAGPDVLSLEEYKRERVDNFYGMRDIRGEVKDSSWLRNMFLVTALLASATGMGLSGQHHERWVSVTTLVTALIARLRTAYRTKDFPFYINALQKMGEDYETVEEAVTHIEDALLKTLPSVKDIQMDMAKNAQEVDVDDDTIVAG
eukprot:TRINITY_DN996_c0_g1_i5.p1 TRINITY_DN996_c0_g1~~TRINITY_DN996_c0_g1_i5.p1  ORF type:complete len:400 (+),score=39.05 TRINITY_DN996_c0_g1_i5:70-1269(+)